MENTLNNNPGIQAVDWDAKLESLGISVRKELRTRKAKFIMPEWAKGWIALIPALIFLILFMIYPILNTFVMSFVNNFYWVGNSGSSFVVTNYLAALQNTRSSIHVSWGIENYIKVLSDPVFLRALGNTGLIVIVSVPLTIIIGLLLAVCLNAIKPLKGLYQTIFFLPYVTNTIALGMVFNAMFSSNDGGLFNAFLGMFGVSPQHWLDISANHWNMFVVIVIYAIWNGLAFKILVFMSGLSAIDKQYYDAARIDGSSKVTIFRRITVPLLSPQILYITITSFIGACKSYSQVISLFGSGAKNFGGVDKSEWITVVGYIVKLIDSTGDSATGRGAAGCVVLLAIVLVITVIQFGVSKSRVHY